MSPGGSIFIFLFIYFLKIVWHDVTDRKDNGQRTMFLSLIGLCNLMLGWPLIFILEITGIETLSLTLNKESIELEQKTLLISHLATASVIAFCNLKNLIY